MNKKTLKAVGRGAVCVCQRSRAAAPVPVRLLDAGRLWRREMLEYEVEHWTVAADTRCREDADQRWSVGYLAVTVRADAGYVPARAAADLAALTLPALPHEPGNAQSALAHFDRALPARMTVTIVNSRHLTGRWPDSASQQQDQGDVITSWELNARQYHTLAWTNITGEMPARAHRAVINELISMGMAELRVTSRGLHYLNKRHAKETGHHGSQLRRTDYAAQVREARRHRDSPEQGWVTVSRGHTERDAAETLWDTLQQAGFRTGELPDHIADLAGGHVIGTQDGREFRVTLASTGQGA